MPAVRGKTLYDVLFRNGKVDSFPPPASTRSYANDEAKAFGFYLQKGLFEEYAEFGRGHGHDLAPFDDYHKTRGCDGRSSTARKRAGDTGKVPIPM